MADDRMALLETLRKAGAEGDVEVLREGVRILAQAIMEVAVSEPTGVPQSERDPERRLTHRNGYRERAWDTRASVSMSPTTDGTQHQPLAGVVDLGSALSIERCLDGDVVRVEVPIARSSPMRKEVIHRRYATPVPT